MSIKSRNEAFWEQRNSELAQLSDEIIQLMEFYDLYDIEIEVVLNLVRESYGSVTELVEDDDEEEDEDLEED